MLLNVTNANKDDKVPGGYSATFILGEGRRAIAADGTWGGVTAQLELSLGGDKWWAITGHAAMTSDDIDFVDLPRGKYRWHVTGISGTTDLDLAVSE